MHLKENGLPASSSGLRPPFYAVTGRHASVSAKASPRQVGFLAFLGRFAPGRAVAGIASARVGVGVENQCKAKIEPDCFLIRFLGVDGGVDAAVS